MSRCFFHRHGIRLTVLSLVISMSSWWEGVAHAQASTDSPPAYQLDASVDGELWRNTRGGTPGNRFLGNGMLSLAVDGAAAWSQPGLSFYGSVLFTNGQFINEDLVGAVQGISNIEAPRALRLYESWLEWRNGADSNSIKFGLYDANSEFDAIETAGLFINPSHGIGPDFSQSGSNGPSIFPNTSFGLRSWHRRGAWYVQFAALDGVPGDPEHETRSTIQFDTNDGLLLLAETGVAIEDGVHVAAGYWHYTAEFDDLLAVDAAGEPLRHGNNDGYYLLLDTPVLVQQPGQSGVNAYVRYGRANADINPVEQYLGAGLVLTDLVRGSGDQLGIAVGIARAGAAFRAAQGQETSSAERITELTYSLPVNDWLAIQPDVQYVEHAGFAADVASAWVIGLRFTLSMGYKR